ncbi:RNA polymerase sigma factor [Oleiharenicola lentus]|uniref:RNA polymerase sigma factor n=1 Tax=Oleiharenicola lentus TaxID=2508720 RepID=UPI003F66AD8C
MSSEVFSQLVDAHYTALFRFALSLTKNSSDAGDLTQQTFFIWAKQGHALREVAKAKSWLFTTLYREFLRGRRRADRVTALEDLGPVEADPPAPPVDVITSMDSSLVLESLQEVDEVYRAPLTLFYLQEFSYKEIADMLEVPIGTVMSRLSRGKAQLRSVMMRKEAGTKVVPFPIQTVRKQS